MANDEQKPNSEAKLPSVDELLNSQANVPSSNPKAILDEGDDEAIDFDPEDVDRILTEEDPKFAEEMKEIQASEFKTDVAIEAVDIEAFLKEGESIQAKQADLKKLSFKDRLKLQYTNSHARISRFIDDVQNGSVSFVKSSAQLFLQLLKTLFKNSFGLILRFFSWLFNLPVRIKLISVSVLILAAASAFSIHMSLKGHFLPQLRRDYLIGFAEESDESFEYKKDDSHESFDSEIRHPEHMFEIEKLVVNLKGNSNAERLPMGLFEFYVELNSQDATVEFSDRKTEARHIIERVLEQLTYEELISPQGKTKLKFIVRKELNEFLSKSHHVRQIYIKTFVLKP